MTKPIIYQVYEILTTFYKITAFFNVAVEITMMQYVLLL